MTVGSSTSASLGFSLRRALSGRIFSRFACSTSNRGRVYPLRPSRPLSRIRLSSIRNHLHESVELFFGPLLCYGDEHRPIPKIQPADHPVLQKRLVSPPHVRQLHRELPQERRFRVTQLEARLL